MRRLLFATAVFPCMCGSAYAAISSLLHITTAPSGLVEIGSGQSYINNGSAGSNVPFRFGFAFGRRDMPLGNTIVVQDDLGNTLSAQFDQLATRTGMPGATDTPGWLHASISVIEPTWGAGTTRTFHLYRQSGSYTPGTGLATSALTSAHHYQVLFQNVKDGGGNPIGSGNFTCDLNSAISAGARTGTGGYDITYNGSVQTTIEAIAPCTDNSTGVADAELLAEFYAVLWQTTPGSGMLGNVELAVRLSQPWQNKTTFAGTGSTSGTTLTLTALSSGQVTTGAQLGIQTIPNAFSQGTVVTNVGTCGGASPTLPCTATINNSQSVTSQTIYGEPRFVYGDASLYDAATTTTLRSYSSTTSFAPASVSLGGIGGYGYVPNTDGVQNGEVVTFSATGGGSVPSPLVANQAYFAFSEYLGPGGTSQPYALSKDNMGSTGYEMITLTNQGSCASGSCLQVTRHTALDQWTGDWLMADDVGHPFWIGANATKLYPALTQAQKTYWETTAIVPGYILNGQTPPSSYDPCLGGGCLAGGIVYHQHALGPQDQNISSGGTHTGIGDWSVPSISWFLNQTTANWDVLRSLALAQSGAFDHVILDSATGYIPAYDNGPYGVGTSYGSRIATGHTTDFHMGGPYDVNHFSGFSTPSVPAGITDTSSWIVSPFASGTNYNGGNNPQGSHEPDYANADTYYFTAEPWELRAAQMQANGGMQSAYPGVGERNFAAGGVNYYGCLFYANEPPRGQAWLERDVVKAAGIGADNDPQKAVMWSYYKENVDCDYAQQNVVFAADPNFSSLGEFEAYPSGTGNNFMWPYLTGTKAKAHALFHFTSPYLFGSSSLYVLNQATKLPAYFQTLLQTQPDSDGHTVGLYWAVSEESIEAPTGTNNSAQPGNPVFAANMGQVGIYGQDAGPRASNLTWDGTTVKIIPFLNSQGASGGSMQDYIENGDQIWAAGFYFQANSLAVFGTQHYNIVNAVRANPVNCGAGGQPACTTLPSYSLTTTPPGTQACSGITGSTGCPAPFAPGSTAINSESWYVNGGTITSGGSGYVNGTYYPMATGGSGSGQYLTVVVSGGAVTSVAPFTPYTNGNGAGSGYKINDVLSAPASSLGGSGSGFSYTVTSIGVHADFAWRPQAAPSGVYGNVGIDGYDAEVVYALQIAINAGTTLPQAPTALTNRKALYTPSTPYKNGQAWEAWYVGPVTIP